MNKKVLLGLVIILGIAFLILAGVYWFIPAASLPAFLPGHEAGSLKVHFKHGIGALFLALGCFAVVWFQSGKKMSQESRDRNQGGKEE